MAVELLLGGKNYRYTPRHPYRETVTADGECAFTIEAPDGSVLCTIKGETGNVEEKKIERPDDLTEGEARGLLRYGFFSPNSAEPLLIHERPENEIAAGSIFKKLVMVFRRERRDGFSNA